MAVLFSYFWNSFIFISIFITILYISLSLHIRRSFKFMNQKIKDNSGRVKKLRKSTVLIILSNLMCWIPLSVLGKVFFSLSKLQFDCGSFFYLSGVIAVATPFYIDNDIYSLIFVLLVPTNSVINPISSSSSAINEIFNKLKARKIQKK